MNPAERGVLCMFAKPPVAGQAKTRLAEQLGDEHATELARAFLRDSWAAAQRWPGAEAVLAATTADEAEYPLPGPLPLWEQGSGDLGRRIETIIQRGLKQHSWVLAIGADTPSLPPARLDAARAALQAHDAVLGPADDGGFYLLGMRRCPPGCFDDLPWSRAETYHATLERLQQLGLSVARIDAWFDVDTLEDLARLHAELRDDAARAAETWGTLQRMQPTQRSAIAAANPSQHASARAFTRGG